ncbi:MAG: cardiolipin synthase [Lachnospiraceae bacterium]|nr:cardiolipin synthase [Lachnospiraceae bacterium]
MSKQAVIDKERRRGDYVLFTDKISWVGFLVLLQLAFLLFAYYKFREHYIGVQAFMSFVSMIVVVYIINRPINPAYKLAWCITILFIPVFGGLFYLILSVNTTRRKFRKSVRSAVNYSTKHLSDNTNTLEHIEQVSRHTIPQARYIYNIAGYPPYENTEVSYFSSGEEMYITMLEEIKKAKHFIFMEYFIIHDGIFWNSILDVLKEKARNGVEVKIIYDDMGSIRTLPAMYYEELRAWGIECYCFNPFSPTLSLRLNNRDHRKITVIDGITSFTGGINIADEYINQRHRLGGYWKDSGVMLKGDATWSFTVMFLQFWQHLSNQKIDYKKYHRTCKDIVGDGFVQPYADNPLYDEVVAENVYLNMINRATNYVYITTPYLIVDNEMITALTLAAQSGVDVRIITPRIPDKKAVFMVTRSFYEPLTKAGVKIYEYVPGFIHEKMMIADDKYAVVGSINLDYRSLYLHFECAVYLHRCKVITEIKEDILDTIEVSQEMTYENCLALNKPYRLWLSLLRLYAPLL